MNNYQKFGLIAGQILTGLGFGIVGGIAVALLATLYSKLIGVYSDLFATTMSAVIGGYIGMQIGIGYDGYKFLKQYDRRKDFIRFYFQSVAGLVFGLLVFYYLILPLGDKLNHSMGNFLAMFLPLTGSIIGFDLGLIKRISNVEGKDG